MDDIQEHIESVKWIWAKTYADFAPHWYIRQHEEPYLYEILRRMIKLNGVTEMYTNHKGLVFISMTENINTGKCLP